MNILITNDDGVMAPALPHLIRWAQKLGDVTCVAPKVEQSGMSQALVNFIHPCEIKQIEIAPGLTAWSMDATPADCVRFGIMGLHKTYDLVISGINRGLNIGHDIVYSGTVGAIFEGARLGHRGLALSTDPDSLPVSDELLDRVWQFICDHDLYSRGDLYNVNFPSAKAAPRGITLTRQGGMFYTDEFKSLGDDMYIQVGAPLEVHDGDLTVDIDAICQGYISVSPLTEKRTDWQAFEALKGLRE